MPRYGRYGVAVRMRHNDQTGNPFRVEPVDNSAFYATVAREQATREQINSRRQAALAAGATAAEAETCAYYGDGYHAEPSEQAVFARFFPGEPVAPNGTATTR